MKTAQTKSRVLPTAWVMSGKGGSIDARVAKRSFRIAALMVSLLATVLPSSVARANPANVWAATQVDRGIRHCPVGNPACNSVAVNLEAQLNYMGRYENWSGGPYSGLDFSDLGLSVPDTVIAQAARTDARGIWAHGHVQGSVQTNRIGGGSYQVFSSSGSGDVVPPFLGSISFARMGMTGGGTVEYVFQRPSEHPASMAQIGKYVLWVEGRMLHVMDVTRLKEYANNVNPPAYIPVGQMGVLPTVVPASAEVDENGQTHFLMGTGGGGIAITRLFDGRYLLAAGLAGSVDGGIQISFYIMRGDLSAPESLAFEHLGNADFECDPSKTVCPFNQGVRVRHLKKDESSNHVARRDENLSLVSDSAGAIYLYLPDSMRQGDAKTNRFLWYRLDLSRPRGTWLVSAVGTHANFTGEPSCFSKGAGCYYSGGTSARIDEDGVLQVLSGDENYTAGTKRRNVWMHPCLARMSWAGVKTYRNWGNRNVLCAPP